MPIVYNKHTEACPRDAVYIGRPSEWGNPFKIGRDGDRLEVINKYSDWLSKNPKLIIKAKQELRGKDLVCFCAPKLCHGHVLLRIAND